MNADEFLALVEARGPLVEFHGTYHGADGKPALPMHREDDESSERWTAECDLAGRLADAAPALAAAAIRLLRLVDSARAGVRLESDCDTLAALRDALPEELRP